MNLQEEINVLYLRKTGISLDHYNNLLRQCVANNEFAATVFVYDHLLKSGIKAIDDTFTIIEKLHSKTIPENNKIVLKPSNEKHLAPRRRIHKIIKGHNYSGNYESAKLYQSKVKAFLDLNIDLKSQPRIKLANDISKGCNITFNEARYIITSLKREGYLKTVSNSTQKETSKTKSLDHFFIITKNNR